MVNLLALRETPLAMTGEGYPHGYRAMVAHMEGAQGKQQIPLEIVLFLTDFFFTEF